jgi:hypothetical protein
MNIISVIPADGWEAIRLPWQQDDRPVELPELIRQPLAGWAQTDDPHQPVVDIVADRDDLKEVVTAYNNSFLVGYVHRSEGLEVLHRRLEGVRAGPYSSERRPPVTSLGERLLALYPAPGWSALFFDFLARDPQSPMPPLVRKPLVGWARFRGEGMRLHALVVLHDPEGPHIGLGDAYSYACLIHDSESLERRQRKVEVAWAEFLESLPGPDWEG